MDNFMKEPFDLKRFVLLTTGKLWMLLLSAGLCSLIFGGFYYGKEVWLSGPAVYTNETLYCITFDREQVEDIHDYYNDYTWNDVLDSDRIAGKAAEITGLPKEEIAAATEIPVMSDIRFFWVTVDADSARRADLIQQGIEEAVTEFAAGTDGFKQIEVYDRVATHVEEKQIYLLRWFVFGFIMGAVIGLLYLLYENALDDSMYVEADVEKRFGLLCLGVSGRPAGSKGVSIEELKTNLSRLLETHRQIVFAESYTDAISDPVTGEAFLTGEYLQQLTQETVEKYQLEEASVSLLRYEKGKEREYFLKLRNAECIVWLVPYGKKDGPKLDRSWKNLHFWSCCPDAAMLVGVNMKYYKAYYAGKKHKSGNVKVEGENRA